MNKEYICRYCGKKFRKKYNLDRHEDHCVSNPQYDQTKLICKFCGVKYDGLRSLSIHESYCKFNPDRKQGHYNVKFRPSSKEGGWDCVYCGKNFITRRELGKHKHDLHPEYCHIGWNKGKTKETDERVRKLAATIKKKYETGELVCPQTGKTISEDVRKKISESMKKAHSDGRAHNIGECRWKNEHSRPERWLIGVLQNEFGLTENVDYRTDFQFYKFSLDFAWPERKICIEMDGDQHEKPEQHRRDMEKDKLLKENDWKFIRIKWKDCCKNPDIYIAETRKLLGY